MLVLGIETSCDETAIALVKNGCEVLDSQVFSQVDRHRLFGGVVPEVAAREHLAVIDRLMPTCLENAQVDLQEIDAIAVTQGPGLVGALLVGVSYAKGLALSSGKPLIPVNHVHAHIHGVMLGERQLEYPALALVASGGHTNLYYMDSPTSFELLAQSMDDACGECFDKVAKVFGLNYPGGPFIEKMAEKGRLGEVSMPRMVEQKSKLAFSYSGLKTYMVNLRRREEDPIPAQRQADIMVAFQEEALGQVARKLSSALGVKPNAKSILVAGGVAANKRFRSLVEAAVNVPVFFPPLKYCSDNAAMIAALGYHMAAKEGLDNFRDLDWDCYSRYQF